MGGPGHPKGLIPTTRPALVDFINKYSNLSSCTCIVHFGTGTTQRYRIYYLDTNSEWKQADKGTNTTGSDQVLAVALGTNPSKHGMLLRGVRSFRAADSLALNFSVGKALYLSKLGYADTVVPTASGNIVRVVGHCMVAGGNRFGTSHTIYFNPEPGWLELV